VTVLIVATEVTVAIVVMIVAAEVATVVVSAMIAVAIVVVTVAASVIAVVTVVIVVMAVIVANALNRNLQCPARRMSQWNQCLTNSLYSSIKEKVYQMTDTPFFMLITLH
jgi:hypothetical protein